MTFYSFRSLSRSGVKFEYFKKIGLSLKMFFEDCLRIHKCNTATRTSESRRYCFLKLTFVWTANLMFEWDFLQSKLSTCFCFSPSAPQFWFRDDFEKRNFAWFAISNNAHVDVEREWIGRLLEYFFFFTNTSYKCLWYILLLQEHIHLQEHSSTRTFENSSRKT